jgi:hypothetical protein
MPDTRTHRGPHPRDATSFAPGRLPALRAAVGELAWLLSHGYATPSALKLVGDRHNLDARQRAAVGRSICSDEQLRARRATCVPPQAVGNQLLLIDGYNVLTTLEVALGGGVVLIGRDGAVRDIAGVHGTWRRVQETLPALRLVADVLDELAPAECHWLLDRPVSNSGRLKAAITDLAADRTAPWQVELVDNADRELVAADAIVASADGPVLDRCRRWFNLAGHSLARAPGAWVVDLSVP